MALLGYTVSCSPNSGGMMEFYAALAPDVESFLIDPITDVYTGVTMESTAKFKKYQFKQDEAELTENINVENGGKQVEHSIEIYLEKLTTESRKAANELADGAICGIIAIEIDNNGKKWVHGYSEEFKKERPIKKLVGEGTSGRVLTDPSGFKLTLTSTDTHTKREFTGEVPV